MHMMDYVDGANINVLSPDISQWKIWEIGWAT